MSVTVAYALRPLTVLISMSNRQRWPQAGLVGIVAGRLGSVGGPPGISGLSDDTSVALDGVVNTILGAPIPVLPAQSASGSNARNPAMLRHACRVKKRCPAQPPEVARVNS